MADFAMSKHALQRALDMALSPDEIRAAVLRPRSSHWADRTQSEWRTNGRVTACVCVSDDGVLVVKTFLWARASDWAADAKHGAYAGREDFGLEGVRKVVAARKRNR